MDMLKKPIAAGLIMTAALYPAGSVVVYLDKDKIGLTSAPIADIKFKNPPKSQSEFDTHGGLVEIIALTSGHAEFLKT